MVLRLNSESGIPLYLQLIEQVKHAIETGAIRPGEQLPSVRQMAVDLVINPNTVVRAYRDLEHEGIIELKHRLGAFVCGAIVPRTRLMNKAQTIVQTTLDQLASFDLSEEEIRRLAESGLSRRRDRKPTRKKYA